jgi:hypothetical protein
MSGCYVVVVTSIKWMRLVYISFRDHLLYSRTYREISGIEIVEVLIPFIS